MVLGFTNDFALTAFDENTLSRAKSIVCSFELYIIHAPLSPAFLTWLCSLLWVYENIFDILKVFILNKTI